MRVVILLSCLSGDLNVRGDFYENGKRGMGVFIFGVFFGRGVLVGFLENLAFFLVFVKIRVFFLL